MATRKNKSNRRQTSSTSMRKNQANKQNKEQPMGQQSGSESCGCS